MWRRLVAFAKNLVVRAQHDYVAPGPARVQGVGRTGRARSHSLKSYTMNMLRHATAALALLLILNSAEAAEPACDSKTLEWVVGHLESTAKGGEMARIAAQTCKPWPARPDILLAAVAYAGAGNAAEAPSDEKRLMIAMIDRRRGVIVSRHHDVIQEDA